VRRDRRQITHAERFGSLPDGAMINLRGTPALVVNGTVRGWSFDGYREPEALPHDATVDVLTPPATVEAFRAGYRPRIHPSAIGSDAAGLVQL
jgi:hypothetical protein